MVLLLEVVSGSFCILIMSKFSLFSHDSSHPQEMSHLRAANDVFRRVLEEHDNVFLTEDSTQKYFDVLSVFKTPHKYSDAFFLGFKTARATQPQDIDDTEQRSR